MKISQILLRISRHRQKNKVYKQSMHDGNQLIIIHNHVFKNAGSTIDWTLRRNFGDAFCDHRDNAKMQLGPKYLKQYLIDNPFIKALSTHYFKPPLPNLNNVRFMTIMMLRHPIERVTSVYNFEQKQIDADTLGAKFAREHDLREYVIWRLRSDVPPTIRNFHIFRCLPAAVNWQKEVDENHLAMAKLYINSVEMLGFVEHFDESMVLFENTLRTHYPEIDMSYLPQNIYQRLDELREKRIQKLKKQIGNDVFVLLLEKNNYDIALYDYARELFKERLSGLTDLNGRLDDFRVRCTRHQGNSFFQFLKNK